MAQELSLDQQRKINALAAQAGWLRTVDIAPDELVPGKILPKATSTKRDWFGPFHVDRPSVFQLMIAGDDVQHLIAVTHKSPDDTTFSEGRVRKNALGRAFCLAVGDYWCFVPLLTGDPAFFTARISDASNDLPAQQAAIEGDSPASALPTAYAPLVLAGNDPDNVAVDDDNTVVRLAANGSARFRYLRNIGANSCGLAFASGKADPLKGIILLPNEILPQQILDGITREAIYAACDTGLTTTLAFQEGV